MSHGICFRTMSLIYFGSFRINALYPAALTPVVLQVPRPETDGDVDASLIHGKSFIRSPIHFMTGTAKLFPSALYIGPSAGGHLPR